MAIWYDQTWKQNTVQPVFICVIQLIYERLYDVIFTLVHPSFSC